MYRPVSMSLVCCVAPVSPWASGPAQNSLLLTHLASPGNLTTTSNSVFLQLSVLENMHASSCWSLNNSNMVLSSHPQGTIQGRGSRKAFEELVGEFAIMVGASGRICHNGELFISRTLVDGSPVQIAWALTELRDSTNTIS